MGTNKNKQTPRPLGRGELYKFDQLLDIANDLLEQYENAASALAGETASNYAADLAEVQKEVLAFRQQINDLSESWKNAHATR